MKPDLLQPGSEQSSLLTRRALLRWLALALGGGSVLGLTQRGECARDARCGGCPLLANCALPAAQNKRRTGGR